MVSSPASSAGRARWLVADDDPSFSAGAISGLRPGAHGQPGPGPGPWAARRRVLVVDDDLLVGRSIARILEDYDVVYAQSAAGALGRVGSGRGFAAIVCDFMMPGMDGIALHDEIARIDPALGRRMVFVTGWPEAPEFTAFRQRTRCAWLPKPFDPDVLRAVVGSAAAGRA